MIAAALAMMLSVAVQAQLAPEQGRQILGKVEPAVVSVKVTVKTTMAMEGREAGTEESENETTGLVVDPSGLAAVSLSALDPTSFYQRMYGEDDPDFQWKSEITDITIHFTDGAEVPGEIAIRDRDLDIAFVKPKEKLAKPAPAVDLAASSEVKILDPVLLVARRGKLSNWATAANVMYVEGVLTKPRTMYLLPTMSSYTEVGAPAFNAEGKVVGTVLLRQMPAVGNSEPDMMMILLPANYINAVARQVEL